jgi:hypothetical protein
MDEKHLANIQRCLNIEGHNLSTDLGNDRDRVFETTEDISGVDFLSEGFVNCKEEFSALAGFDD